MDKKLDIESIKKNLLPRLLKAALWCSLTYILFYFLPTMILSSQGVPVEYFIKPLHLLVITTAVLVFMTNLFSGTFLAYIFGVGKALIIIACLIQIFEGGQVDLVIPLSSGMTELGTDITIGLSVDLRVFLGMIISVNLLSVTKNILQTINFLTEKTDTLGNV
jgi:hypothetical protein